MRRVLLVVGLLLATSCSQDDPARASVAISDVKVSNDRRTLTVTTSYADSIACGKDPGGVDVDIRGDVAVGSTEPSIRAGGVEGLTMLGLSKQAAQRKYAHRASA